GVRAQTPAAAAERVAATECGRADWLITGEARIDHALDQLHRLQSARTDVPGRPARYTRDDPGSGGRVWDFRKPPYPGRSPPRTDGSPHQRARPRRWLRARTSPEEHQYRCGSACG